MTQEELHALLIGLFEALCPWPARYHIIRQSEFKPGKEHHYYLGGRVAGFILLLATLIIAAAIARTLLRF